MRSFTASLPMALLRARETAMQLFRPMLAAHELTEQQWRVLRALSSAHTPTDAGDVAELTVLLPPSLSRILVNLEERGLVARRPDPSDQRRNMITLTSSGQATVREVAPESEQRYSIIEAAFGTDRLHRLLSELHDLAELDLSTSGTEGNQ